MKTLVVICLFAAYSFGQCTLTPDTVPAVRGLRLETSETDFKKKWGRTSFLALSDAERLGFFTSPDIKDVRVDFINGRLEYFHFIYDPATQWNGAMEMAEAVSKHLNLPDEWKREHRDAVMMKCSGFFISITTLPSNKLAFTLTRHSLPDRANHVRKATFKP